MKIDLITKEQLGIVSRRILKYPLHTTEKDYFLTLALQIISKSDLKDRLVFKGGTALHHHYLPQYRFSEDLDFTTTDQKVTTAEIKNVLEKAEFFKVIKAYTSPVTAKIEKLQYRGILDQPNSLKIDISNVKNLALKPQDLKYINAWGIDFNVKVMDILEICAEKLSATSGRVRYRDFYDLFLITQELGVKIDTAIGLLSQKDVEAMISKEKILRNWTLAIKAKQNDLDTIFLKKQVKDKDIEHFIMSLNFEEITPRTARQN